MNQMDTEESTEDLQPDSQVEESDSVATEANESLDTSVEPEEGSEPNENSDNAEPSDENQSGDLDFDDITQPDDIDALVDAWEHRTEEDDEPEPELEQQEEELQTEEDEPPLVDEEETEPEPEKEPEPPSQELEKPVRRRFAAKNELENEFVSVKQRNPDISIEDALAIARSNLGIETKPTEPEQPSEEKAEELTGPQSSREAQELADQAFAERQKALQELDFEKVAELDTQIRELDKNVYSLQEKEANASKEAEVEFDNNFDSSQEKAIKMYPDAGKQNSKLAERMREIDQSLKETGNDLYYDADKPTRIAQMAANEMGISPYRPGKQVSPPKASEPPKSPKKVPTPPPSASGSARTTTQSTSEDDFSRAIESIQTADQMDDFLDSIGAL